MNRSKKERPHTSKGLFKYVCVDVKPSSKRFVDKCSCSDIFKRKLFLTHEMFYTLKQKLTM